MKEIDIIDILKNKIKEKDEIIKKFAIGLQRYLGKNWTVERIINSTKERNDNE